MATINTFKEVKSWQFAKDLAVECYKITKEPQFIYEFALINQIRKCSISVPSNIAEGFERKGNKEFIQFLFIAAGSLGELQCQLIITEELGFIDAARLAELERKIVITKRTIYGMVTYIKSSEQKGYKFSEPEAVYGKNPKLNDVSADELSNELQVEAANVWSEYQQKQKIESGLETIELSPEFILQVEQR